MRILLAFVCCAFLSNAVVAQYGDDESLATNPNEDFIKTSMLPGGTTSQTDDNQQMTYYNSRELPELSSGVIGTTVYNESIFYSGLYRMANANGQSFSSRVRIPNYVMLRINRTEAGSNIQLKRAFYFNYTKGLWEETIDSTNFFVRVVMGVHAYYSRTFFLAIRATRKQVTSTKVTKPFGISTYHMKQLEDNKFTEDFSNFGQYEDLASQNINGVLRKLSVNGAADSSDSEIIIYSNGLMATNSPGSNIQFTFEANKADSEMLFWQTVAPSKDATPALEEFRTIQNSVNDINGLLQKHTEAWDLRFKTGSIEVEGTGTNAAKLRRMVKSTLYQIYSQFPFANRYGVTSSTGTAASTVEDVQFNGVSACGLGRGGNSSRTARIDFAGHVTTDQELYLFEPLAILQPDLARHILFYRSRQIQGSPPVPFETARSGLSVEPVWCQHCTQQAQYATGLLGLAVRRFHAITRDQTWVDLASRGGLEIMEKIARYFDQKIQKNSTRSGEYYSITGVCGPDENHQSQTNNLFTNALAALSIHYWGYLKCLSNKGRDAAQDTLVDHARRLAFPFNSVKGTNEQFEGYDGNTLKSISETDALLAYFPVAWNMSGHWLEEANVKRLQNDLTKYGSDFVSTSGYSGSLPATAHAINAILRMQIGTSTELSNGNSEFETLKSYASTPFHVWRNLTDKYDASAAGHIGTAASFLSTLISGFGGLRVQATRLDILRPSLPTEVTSLTFKGLNFFGGEFDYTVTADRIRFASTGGSAFKTAMQIYDRTLNKFQAFSGSGEQTIPAQVSYGSVEATSSAAIYSIVSETNFNCPLEDQNYNSHNPYYWSGASGHSASLLQLLLSAIVAIFVINRRDLQ